MYQFLATGIVAIHLGYVAFVVLAQALILVGMACRWRWTRNLRFRVTHLVMTEIVALEGMFNVRCPMTDWQERIEAAARTPAAAVVTPPPPAEPAANPTNGSTPANVRSSESGSPTTKDDQPPIKDGRPAPAPTGGDGGQVAASKPDPAGPPPPPAMPVDSESSNEDQSTTFVGRILNSILYLDVGQEVLDRWYVRFGALTLLTFLAYPPRLGTWTLAGFTGMILVWLGIFTALAAWYELAYTAYPRATQTPLEVGVILLLVGLACLALTKNRLATPSGLAMEQQRESRARVEPGE